MARLLARCAWRTVGGHHKIGLWERHQFIRYIRSAFRWIQMLFVCTAWIEFVDIHWLCFFFFSVQKPNWVKSYKNHNGNVPATCWPPKSTGAQNQRSAVCRASISSKVCDHRCSDYNCLSSILLLFTRPMLCVRWKVSRAAVRVHKLV